MWYLLWVCGSILSNMRWITAKCSVLNCISHRMWYTSMNEKWRWLVYLMSLQWRHNGRDCASNHQHHHYLLNRLFRRRSKKTSNLRVTALCAGHSPGTGEYPAQMASNAENVSIWWRHHGELYDNGYDDISTYRTYSCLTLIIVK